MSDADELSRRDFVKLCASAVALAGLRPEIVLGDNAVPREYQRVRLIDADNRAFTPARFKVGETYLFHYPYVSTPCFLVDLGHATQKTAALVTEDGRAYEWHGGVGPKRSIVAFSAICAHKMSHPARAVSFINYRHQPVTFQDKNQKATKRGQVIYCCSERSVYDPAAGARVLGGPAPQPLAAILLEHAADGALYARGTYGGEMFDKFFQNFGHRVALEMRVADIRTEASGTAIVVPLAEYCQNQVLC